MSLGFFREFLRSPSTVGAIWPSSPRLAARMASMGGIEEASTVVELGPGTGALTGELLRRMPKGARFAAIERNPALVRALEARFPQATILEGCAGNIGPLLAQHGMGAPQAVFSGLPWAAFDASLQETILAAIRQALAPGGVFITFAYRGPHLLPAGRRFRAALEATFARVETSGTVLGNLPPAFVYRCEVGRGTFSR
jgi:phosphatidylethanolamine/phosphatidyl-N-methylethanolamine N-methyltransferase